MENHDLLQQTILGCLLAWPEEADKAAKILVPEDFTSEKYREVFKYIVTNDGGDLVTVSTALRGKVTADELCMWISHEATSAFLVKYCNQLKEISRKIQVYELSVQVQRMFNTASSMEMLEKIEAQSITMASKSIREPVGAKTLVIESVRNLKHRYENRGKIQGISYGYADIDASTQGMHRGELVIVAARPSMGKTAFALNIAENVCEDHGSVMVFSLEMPRGGVMDRILSSRGRILYSNIRSGNLNQSEFVKMASVSDAVSLYNFSIDDTPGITLREIRSKARRQKKAGGLDVLIIDYLQLMGVPAKENRTQAIGEISRGLKQLALELNITVIALSQLNRTVESRNDKRPAMSDLRDSGEIEQDADVLMFPFREAAYCEDCKRKSCSKEGHQNIADITIAKQRNGEANIRIPLVWMGHYQRFQGVNSINLD
jgi:replicative DNA helicase